MSKVLRPIKPGDWGILPAETWHRRVALGNGTQFEIVYIKAPEGCVIQIVDAFMHQFRKWAHASYVQQKLRLSDGDAANLADLINQLNGHRLENWGGPQGTYDQQWMEGT